MAKKRKKKNPPKAKAFRRARKKTKKTLPKTDDLVHRTRMRIIGIGGGGGSIISEISSQVSRVDFVAANTDLQALRGLSRKIKPFSFGQNITHGLGCGMDPRLGQKVARDEKEKIAKLFKGVDLAVLAASLGGGTGSGAMPEFAKIARDMGLITFGIFTMPFKFEGSKKAQVAKSSLEKATPFFNAVSIIPNENIFQIIDKTTPIRDAFSAVNKRLADNLRGLIEMIYLPGLVNIDFADLRTILDGRGKLAYLNTAVAEGQNRADQAIKEVLKSPLNEYTIGGAERILFNITASQGLKMKEVEDISKAISDFNRRARIIFGVSQDNSYQDRIRISLLAVGLGPKVSKPKLVNSSKIKQKKKPAEKPLKESLKNSFKKSLKNSQKKKPLKKSPKKPLKEKTELEPTPSLAEKSPIRRTAMDLKKAVEKTADELLEQEKQWDIPAFLRRNEAGDNQ